ncbi:Histone-lysine N-methyltransferase SUV39H1 [Smittium culicis]|nr:Histone-lysine N-methyltransferase SUV39H1 [Smittium culicis]OMJ14080.1 Histone-lysine N-methyltransferase SUV39H1 [Smittium culicis]
MSVSSLVSENIKSFLKLVENFSGPPITIVNNVDDVPPPADFEFINTSIYALNVPRPQEFDVFPCCCESHLLEDDSHCISMGNKSLTLSEFKKSKFYDSSYIKGFRERFSPEEFDTRLKSICTPSLRTDTNTILCSHNLDGGNPYNSKGLLILPESIPIYECNWTCACGPLCFNRIVQRGPTVSLQIFRTRLKGWGVRTLQPLQKGQFIAEYVGEIITNEEADRRGKKNDKLGSTYLFDLDADKEYDETCEYTIDAANYGNITHFLNHSCVPNLKIRAVYTSHWDSNLHQLAFFTTERIPAGTELTFDYNPGSPFPGEDGYESRESKKKNNKRKGRSLNSPSDYVRLENTIDTRSHKSSKEKSDFPREPYKCYCGAPRCRGFVFF